MEFLRADSDLEREKSADFGKSNHSKSQKARRKSHMRPLEPIKVPKETPFTRNVEYSNEIQRKIDYFITPYNHILEMNKSVSYQEQSSFDTEEERSRADISAMALWTKVANFIISKRSAFKEKLDFIKRTIPVKMSDPENTALYSPKKSKNYLKRSPKSKRRKSKKILENSFVTKEVSSEKSNSIVSDYGMEKETLFKPKRMTTKMYKLMKKNRPRDRRAKPQSLSLPKSRSGVENIKKEELGNSLPKIRKVGGVKVVHKPRVSHLSFRYNNLVPKLTSDYKIPKNLKAQRPLTQLAHKPLILPQNLRRGRNSSKQIKKSYNSNSSYKRKSRKRKKAQWID
ncbi:unnamed protein product [Moneuplotes crassus]|uniref:Uncharacterized protein n=1 Tax=Euplotes crassus TaxID=5936 RepID=A0AAD1UDV4_EUPCR|nr:unnamed protein product [Moneuplotes crassus]